ncbi:MAG TPA: hypothetical protein VFW40_09715 [Capsulimonadaceae bacterium]|nr:hypothetical protein [Capsulimonadaceae bacterium]
MSRSLSFLRAVSSALLPAAVAPSTGTLVANPPGMTIPTTQADTYTVTVDPNTSNLQSTVEHLPNAQLAWEFDHESDGTVAIKGPNSTIWRGDLRLNSGPQTPPMVSPGIGHPEIEALRQAVRRLDSLKSEQKPVLPGGPDLTPILPPGESKPSPFLPQASP